MKIERIQITGYKGIASLDWSCYFDDIGYPTMIDWYFDTFQ